MSSRYDGSDRSRIFRWDYSRRPASDGLGSAMQQSGEGGVRQVESAQQRATATRIMIERFAGMQKCWPDERHGRVCSDSLTLIGLSIAGAPIDRLRRRETRAKLTECQLQQPAAESRSKRQVSSRRKGWTPFVLFIVENGMERGRQPPESRQAKRLLLRI